MVEKFGRLVATMGFGPFAGKRISADIGFVPQETRVYWEDEGGNGDRRLWDTVSAVDVDILKSTVTVTERMACPMEEYEEWVRNGVQAKLLGESVGTGADGKPAIVAVVERTTCGKLEAAEFRSEGLHIRYDPNDAKPVSFVIFNYEPVTNLSHLSVSASALRRGTGWLTVNMSIYPVIQS